MEQFISQLARQSVAAGWVILALLVLRPLLKKLPRAYVCLLWALAAVRLVLPIAVKSPVSLVPQRVANPTAFIPITPIPVTPAAAAQDAAQAAAPAAQSISALLPWLWLAGVAVMGLYAIVSYIRLLSRVQVSIRLGDRLYISDNVASPFILGIFRPKIYLPSEMDQAQARLVLAHERSHLRRGDHLWKPLGYALLCLHWFNPLCWVAYLLLCRDIEQACDEAVVKDMAPQDKKAYSSALLECSLPRSAISVCPLAFGEVGVKQRIRGILNYRKPKLWALAVSGLVCVTLAACFLTDPVKGESGTADSPQILSEAIPLEIDGAPSDTIMVFPQGAAVYDFPYRESRETGEIAPGEARTVEQREMIGEEIWGYVRSKDYQSNGWVYLSPVVGKKSGELLSLLPKEATVYASPSAESRELGEIVPGDIYTVVETETVENEIWGRVQVEGSQIDGWILLGTEVDPPDPAYLELLKELADKERIYNESHVIERIRKLEQNGQKETGASVGTETEKITLRSNPSEAARVIGQIDPDKVYTVVRREQIGDQQWAFVQSGEITGWVLLDGEAGSGEQAGVLATEVPEEESLSSDATIPLSKETTLRISPSSDAWEICKIADGEAYTIERRDILAGKTWAYIQYGDLKGWILLEEQEEADSHEEPGAPDGTEAVTSPRKITLRSNPSENSRVIGEIDADENFTIMRREQIGTRQWAFVQSGEMTGWVLLEEQEETVPDEWTGERFAQNTNVRSTPSLMANTVYQADAGEGYTIVRQDFMEGKCWAFVRVQGSDVGGWIYLKDESEALAYFRDYVAACTQQTPDAAEEYLYFATEDAREYFRYMYAPVTGWAPTGIFRVNENLWGIQYADTQSQRAVYSFVGRMDDRLYVFQTVHDVPEALRENLDVAAYEEPNAMYVSDEWKAGFLISTRLMAFAEPARVEIAGDKDYSNASAGLSFADMVCGTDTWQKAELPQAGKAGCTITLHAADGSTAVLSDATPAIVVTYPDGTQEAYQDYATGEENIAMIYNWAKELAQ